MGKFINDKCRECNISIDRANCLYCSNCIKIRRNRDKTNWRKNNPKKQREIQKKYRDNHKEYFKEKTKEWRRNNLEKARAINNNRAKKYYKENTAKENLRHNHRLKLKPILVKKYRGCQKCGNNKNLELHHTKYTNSEKGVLLLCRNCHNKINKQDF